MSEEGEKMLGAIRQMRELHGSVSLLLKTADAAMAEQAWTNATNSATAFHEGSASIDLPDRWMPREVFRYYKHADRAPLLASIAVLLDGAEDGLSEPLLSAALFDYGDGNTVAGIKYWFAGIYKVIPDREADGRFLEILRSQLEQSWQSDFEKAWCFACPLANITSESFLRQNVVEKLIAKAENLN